MLTQDFSKRGQALFFYNLKPSVVAVFEGVQPKDFITYYHRHDLDHLFQRWKLVYTYLQSIIIKKKLYFITQLIIRFIL